jgi:DMSO/TMAO reductase YedYZ molybdopterin-dependent catalytic subunit
LNERYIQAKEKWARKQSAAESQRGTAEASSDRLPPGQRLTKDFPVLDLGVQPLLPPARWKLTLDGLVENPRTLNWDEFSALPRVEDICDFHCVTTWSKFDCAWSGVPFTTLYELVQPKPEAKFVWITAFDSYTTSLPLEKLLDDDVMVATHFEGQPLTREHGAPARLVVPKLYAWKGAKFLKQLSFQAEDRLGFWEIRGYSNSADPFREERFA